MRAVTGDHKDGVALAEIHGMERARLAQAHNSRSMWE